MNFQFSVPPLLETPQFSPNKLIQLASNLPDTTISIPTVDKVLEAIEQGKADQVSTLEWVYCIHAKAQWDEQNLELSQTTSAAIWKAAISHSWLQHHLLWHIALYYSGQEENNFAQSLAESFDVLANSESVNKLLTVKIIQAIRSQKPRIRLAKIACEQLLTQSELINRIKDDLPVWIPFFSDFVKYISPCFSKITSPTRQQVKWLLSCLDEMSEKQQLKAVDNLLVNVANNIVSNHPVLVEWLRQNYRNVDKWYQLSEPAKQKLKEWIGGINYSDFQNLVELILNRLNLQKFESNQLRRRREFWINYSNRFERLRILLPKTSQLAIGSQIKGDVDLLEDDGSDPTEVCIFDFGEWFVVEFFRGRGSETRLLPNNSKNQQILFGESRLSVKRIRCLGGDRHDHVFLWQEFSPKWLEKHQILPNTNTRTSRYLTADKLQTREKSLARWKIEIESLEREARAYCNKICFLTN
ncbi:hypothetical protein H6G33_18620 [Calothrix sp. FACHB-1219]|uniref:EH signature domain-containing protein n=1 Tax=unclassified Calothrix TaxID=2619626 RepID=UPI001688975E|nr:MULTISPECIES: EH signature domain-containing protein [unclassified Calothrix]MBD2203446.1 hypothetical protein [Calothrix sp. FACHB-168]MBD2219038.1 hypothetical protein [Calothrix sp. FACHB-1219]